MSLKGSVVGRSDESGVQLPPLHPRCICTIIYRELTSRAANGTVGVNNSPATHPRTNVGSENLPVVAERGFESKSFVELQGYIGKLDDVSVRKRYIYHDKHIHEQIDQSLSLEEKARQAFELRNLYRTQARELIFDQKKRRELDANNPNPSFEEILAHKMNDKGLSYEQALQDIYETATKSNPKVNQRLGLEDDK